MVLTELAPTAIDMALVDRREAIRLARVAEVSGVVVTAALAELGVDGWKVIRSFMQQPDRTGNGRRKGYAIQRELLDAALQCRRAADMCPQFLAPARAFFALAAADEALLRIMDGYSPLPKPGR